MNTVILIPWRDRGDEWRRANLLTVLAHLKQCDLAPVRIVGDNKQGPFNRSAAYNRGTTEHPADIFIFHEADMIVPAEQLEQSIRAAEQPGLIIPFDTYHYLTPGDTERVRAGTNPQTCTPQRVVTGGRSTGAVNTISTETMTAVGRWDEQFQGWGWDDRAMTIAFAVATGTPTRNIPGTGVHLWHPPAGSVNGGIPIPTAEQQATNANRRRYRLYQNARTPQHIRALTGT